MKKMLSLTLALLLLLGAMCAGAQADYAINTQSLFPVVTGEDPVSLSITVSTANDDGDVKDMWLFQWLENVSGIDLEVTGITKDAWEARKNLIINSGDLADIYWGFNWSTTELYQYGMEGMFLDLSQYVEQYGSQLKKVDEYIGHDMFLGAATSPNGAMYSLPAMTEPAADMLNRTTYGMSINTDMLEKVGKDIPTNMEELYEALEAITAAGMNGTMSAQYDAEFRSLTLAAYQIITDGEPNNNIALKQTAPDEWKVVFTPYDESYRDWLAAMNRFYAAGMIDENFFTTDVLTRAGLNQVDPAAVIQSTTDQSIGKLPEIYEKYQVFLLNESDAFDPITYNVNHAAMGAFVVTSECEHPDVAVALCNTLYDPATMLTLAFGPYVRDEFQYDDYAKEIGCGYDINWNEDGTRFASFNTTDAGEWDKDTYPNYNDLRKALVAPSQVYNNFYPISGLYARVTIYNADARNVGDVSNSPVAFFRVQQQANIPLIAYRYPDVYLDTDTYTRALELKSELEDYVYMMEGQFISGALSLDADYDAFIEQLKTLGVEEYVQIYTEAYANR